MKIRYVVLIGLVAAAVIGGAGYLGYRSSRAASAPAVEAPPTVPVSRGDVVLSVTAPGLLVDRSSTTLAAQVNGTLDSVNVHAGDVVTRGEVLAQIGNRDTFAAAVAEDQVQVLQKQQALDALVANAPVATAQAQAALVQAEQHLTDTQRSLQALLAPNVRWYQEQVMQAQNALTNAQQNSALVDISALQVQLRNAQAQLTTATNVYNNAKDAFAKCPTCLQVYAYDRMTTWPDAVNLYNDAVNLVQQIQVQIDQGQRGDALGITAAQDNLATAQQNLDTVLQGAEPLKVKAAQADVSVAEAQVEQAQRDWARLKDGPDPMSLKLAQADLANAQMALTKAQTDLDNLEIRAPFDGVVLSVAVMPGQSVGVGAPVATLTIPKTLEIQATVVQEDYPLVQVGQSVNLYFDALPDVNVTGHVVRIVPQRTADAQPEYPIYIALDTIPDHLAAGMTSDGSIVIASQSSVLRLPRSVVRAHSDGTAEVDVWADGQVETRSVRVGLRGDSYVEILTGLTEGDQVVAQ